MSVLTDDWSKQERVQGPDDGDRILVVDDDDQVRRMIARTLTQDEYAVELSNSPAAAMDLMTRLRFSLVVSDVHMPGSSGVALVRSLRALQPHLGVLMVSGDDNPLVAAIAAEQGGAFSYLVKPFTPNELRINVSNVLLRRRLELSALAQEQRLREAIDERTRELSAAIRGLRSSREATIRHLSKAVEMRDATTHAHIDRIGETSAVLATALGYSPEAADLLRIAAPMHDVGKIGIPDRILLKPGSLTAAERTEMQRHTSIGYAILSGSESELLNLAASVALTHHERIDGTGYPRGLCEDAIPLDGRIVAVADVFDALINDRVYRPALPLDEALALMKGGRGTQFDPLVLDAFFTHLSEILMLQPSASSELLAVE